MTEAARQRLIDCNNCPKLTEHRDIGKSCAQCIEDSVRTTSGLLRQMRKEIIDACIGELDAIILAVARVHEAESDSDVLDGARRSLRDTKEHLVIYATVASNTEETADD